MSVSGDDITNEEFCIRYNDRGALDSEKKRNLWPSALILCGLIESL